MSIKDSSYSSMNEDKHYRSFGKPWLAGVLVSTLLVGCASSGKKVEEAEVAEAPVEEVKAEETTAANQQEEKQADAMMASLAKKSKFDEEPEPAPVVKEKAPEPVVAKAAPAPVAKKAPEPVKPKVAAPAPKVEAAKPAPAVAEVKQEAPAAPVAKKNTKKNMTPLNATLSDLPIDYDIWKIRKGEASLDNDIVITTPTWEMGERGFMSQIWVTVMDDKLLINSSSDIATTEGKTGIKLDNGELIPFDKIAEGNIGVLEGAEWLDKLANSNELKVMMGFFPDRVPKSGIYESALDLDKLGRVVSTYKNLSK